MKFAIVGAIHQKGLDFLKLYGHTVIEITDISTENLKEKLLDVDGVILRTALLPNEVLEVCPNIKIISRHGVGYDNVDLNYLNKHKIALGVTGTANAVSVAEHVMAFFFQHTKKINISDEVTKKGNFNERINLPNFFELYKKNILIFGFGRIGQALAKRCLGFEMDVYVYDPFIKEEVINDFNCKIISKEEGLRKADYVSIHLPFNDNTKDFISFNELKIMKSNAFLVNTARGGIVNEKYLYDALKNKRIAGAGLDVFEKEPPSLNNPLLTLSNILLTPHNAALSLECRIRMSIESCENIIFYIENSEKLNKSNIINMNSLRL